jgi:hypothetical protein
MGLTGQGKFHLSVKEGREGKPFLKLEPTGANKHLLGGGYIALTLREGATFGEAQALADTMKKQISGATIARG